MVHQIIPKLPFIKKEKTLDFYIKLGFSLDSDYGNYFIMSKDGQEIHFFEFQNLLPFSSDFMIYLRIENIAGYYKKLQNDNINIHPNGNLEKKPWNMQEFSLLDPNGTLLTFGEATT